jgi:hypothetical protein
MRNLPTWASSILAVAGVVMVASMFFNWIDIALMVDGTATGISIAWSYNHWLFVVPAAGAWLAVASVMRARHARLAAFAAGFAVAGDVAYEFGKDMFHMDAGGWLVLGGAAVVLFGVPTARRSLRVIGGIAMVVGYFMPGGVHTESLSMSGVLIAIAGVVAALSGFSASPKARWVALAAGGMVYALLLLVLGFGAYLVFGIGAWAAFGASVVAFAIALAAPARAPKIVPSSRGLPSGARLT